VDVDHQDSLDLRGHILRRPDVLNGIVAAGGSVDGLPDLGKVANVVVIGIGEAAVAGDLIATIAGPFMSVPLVVHRGYELPSFVGPDTFVIALSASGSTEETVEATEAAYEAGAALLSVTGRAGHLAELSEVWRTPVLALPEDLNPRFELVPLAVASFLALEQMGAFPGAREWIGLAVDQLERRRDEVLGGPDPAAAIARTIGRTFPVIYGAGPIGAVAALRWKHQFNLSAKVPAISSAIPDLCHNEIAGWGQHGDVTRQVFTRIDLRHDHEHPHDTERFERVAEMTLEVVGEVARLDAGGEGALAQLLDLMFVGDLCAVELALSQGVDPGPVPAVEALRITAR
jgi:glucose/mannose-6-phosphate isomerase